MKDLFDEIWDRLAELGYSDERGGMEYRRVRTVWDERDRVTAVVSFILSHCSPATWSWSSNELSKKVGEIVDGFVLPPLP